MKGRLQVARCNCKLWLRWATVCLRSVFSVRMVIVVVVFMPVSLLIPGSATRKLFENADRKRRQLLLENEERIERSQLFLKEYRTFLEASHPARPLGADPEAEVGVTVLTMARGRRMSKRVSYRTQYLTQSLARLLKLLNDTSLTRSYRLAVCDVDDFPNSYSEARELEDIVPFFKRFGGGGEGSEEGTGKVVPGQPNSGARGVTIWEKLKHDYVYCLQQTMSQGVRYALLVEDDAIAHVQLLPVLEHVLKTVLEAPGARPVTYAKLFHPDRLLGYISLEVERLAELFSLSVCVGLILTLALRSKTKPSPELQDREDRFQSLTSWLGWTIVVVLIAMVIGRTNLLELRRLSPQLYQVTPTPSCCTPAMLFTQKGARDVSDYLLSVTCSKGKSTDYRLDEFRHVTGARALLVQPNLFTHIGLVSSLREEEVSPLIVN